MHLNKNATTKLNQFFNNKVATYQNNFKDKHEVFTFLNMLPSQIDTLLSTCSPENKQLTILALLLQLADTMVYLTNNKILQLTLVRRYEQKAHYGQTAGLITYKLPITTPMNDNDFNSLKENKSFEETASTILTLLKQAAFDRDEINQHNTNWFSSLSKLQEGLLTSIQAIINKLNTEVQKVSIPRPQLQQ